MGGGTRGSMTLVHHGAGGGLASSNGGPWLVPKATQLFFPSPPASKRLNKICFALEINIIYAIVFLSKHFISI